MFPSDRKDKKHEIHALGQDRGSNKSRIQMIAFLKGQVVERGLEQAVLNVNGVGYEVHISSKTLQDLQPLKEAELFIYTHVREDTLRLFGFSQKLEKKIFLALIGINGIGPKMALSLLSSTPSLRDLVAMIEEENIKALTRLPRVGKKSAQQIVLALKGHLKEGFSEESEQKTKIRRLLSQALLNLGFRSGEIQLALDHVQTEDNMEKGLKEALSYLNPQSGSPQSGPPQSG